MAELALIDPAMLENLPVEVIVHIFCLLPDFPALFAVIATCTRLRAVYQSHDKRILSAILQSISDNAPSGLFTLASPEMLKPSPHRCAPPIYSDFLGLLVPLPLPTLMKIGPYEGYLWQFYQAIPRHVLTTGNCSIIFNTMLDQMNSGNQHIVHALIPFGKTYDTSDGRW